MGGKKLKSDHSQEIKLSEKRELNSLSELNKDDSEKNEVCINSIFQDDLLEQILVYLPIESIIIAGLVCKKWQKITTSQRFLWNASQTTSQKPWFLKCINCYENKPIWHAYHQVLQKWKGRGLSYQNKLRWYAYDPVLQKWKGRDFLDMVEPWMFRDSCDGLVCYMNSYGIYVCNPIKREHKMVQEVPEGLSSSDYPVSVNISVNRRSHSYKVAAMCLEKVSGSDSILSFQVYDSETMKWSASRQEVLTGWMINSKRVICNGVLYFQIYSAGGGQQKHGVLAYDLSNDSSSHGTLMNSFTPVPCSVVGGLLNLKGQLFLIEAIGKPGNHGFNNGFCIWVLIGEVWQEISRVTHTCFYNRDILQFDSSGAEDLVYIHAKYNSGLVVFDMNLKQWKSSVKIPSVHMLNGFCFQPRLDISP